MQDNPAPFSAYVHAQDLGMALASSSQNPCSWYGTESCRPPRSRHLSEEGHERKLPNSESHVGDQKERAEHRMLVVLMRNDLTQVAEPGSINVERFDVESYANVQHLVSHITAALKPTLGGSDALAVSSPVVPSRDAHVL